MSAQYKDMKIGDYHYQFIKQNDQWYCALIPLRSPSMTSQLESALKRDGIEFIIAEDLQKKEKFYWVKVKQFNDAKQAHDWFGRNVVKMVRQDQVLDKYRTNN